VAGSEVQEVFSMQPRFRNDILLITHVLDQCVKLLVVLHISSAQCRSVDLSVEIATGRRNRHHLNSWSSGSSSMWRMIS